MVECVLCVLCECKDFLKIDKLYPGTRHIKLRTKLHLYHSRNTQFIRGTSVLTERQHLTLRQQKVGMTDRGAIRLVNVPGPTLDLESSLK